MRRQMKPWEVVATLIKAGQLRVIYGPHQTQDRVAIICLRTGKEITLDNVKRIQIEHWPVAHEHGGDVSPDNAIVSLAEGHMQHSARETQGRGKERRLQIARHAKDEIERKITKPKWRLKKKVSGEVVKVRTR